MIRLNVYDMSELGEPKWAVISERGCERTGIAHADAVKVMRQLMGEKVGGLCVVTDDTCRRLKVAVDSSAVLRSPA